MIELSKRQLYVFLIKLMTVTQKWCLKTNKSQKLPLHPEWIFSVILLISTNYCCYLYPYSFLKNVILDVVSVPYMKNTLQYVTKWIYNTIWKRIIIGWLLFYFKTNYEVSTPISTPISISTSSLLLSSFADFSSPSRLFVYVYGFTRHACLSLFSPFLRV